MRKGRRKRIDGKSERVIEWTELQVRKRKNYQNVAGGLNESRTAGSSEVVGGVLE